jgi:hypothetical protein
MKTKLMVAIMLTSLLAGMLAVVPIRPAGAVGNATLSITPSTVTRNPPIIDSFFDVFVEVTTDTGLFGFDLKVMWDDDTLVNLDNATSWTNTATLLGQIWTTGWYPVMFEVGGGGGGGGYLRVVALSTGEDYTGTHSLINLHFQIMKSCNFYLHTHITIDNVVNPPKLSDKFWQSITVTALNPGLFEVTATTPDLELVLVNPDILKPFEYCKTFEVEVYASHICAQMTDYDLTILYNAELLRFVDIDYWGVFGTGIVDGSTLGVVHVWMAPGVAHMGDSLLLFALTFHIEFDDRIEHIWRVNAPQQLDAQISIKSDVGEFSFLEGIIPITGITLPPPITVTVDLIQGDVDCNGKVDVFDLRCLAASYDKSTPEKYDLTNDTPHYIDIFDLVVVATNFHYGW